MAETVVYDFLEQSDADQLIEKFRDHQIHSQRIRMIGRRHAPSLFLVVIDDKELKKAKPTLTEFRKNQIEKDKANLLICSNCKAGPSTTHEVVNIGWFRRIFSMGTRIVGCSECGHEWYI
jgi:hypothetical protein